VDYILIVEDETAIRTLLRANLVARGYTVLEARSAEQAWLQITQDSPQLVLLDNMLPKMSGIQLMRDLSSHPKTMTIPVIFVSAYIAQRSDEIQRDYPQVVDVITKPFNINQIITAVRRALGKPDPQ
jgi:two-component system, OmpR family, phosphate regulon response regulator PhoB